MRPVFIPDAFNVLDVINVIFRDMLHLVACNCLATNLIAMHTSFVVAGEAHMGVTWVEFLGWSIIL